MADVWGGCVGVLGWWQSRYVGIKGMMGSRGGGGGLGMAKIQPVRI